MTAFLLIRHAEADYSKPGEWNAPGWGADLAPLTTEGQKSISKRVEEIVAWNPQIVLCSPTTRTMQTALLIREYLNVPFQVEFDLHEWVPRYDFNWSTFEEVLELIKDLELHNCEWPKNEKKPWEPFSQIRIRVSSVLKKYTDYEKVMVICHGMVIRSLTGMKINEEIKHLEQVKIQSEQLQ